MVRSHSPFALQRLEGVVKGRLRRRAAAHAVFHAIAYAAVRRQYANEIEASSLFSPILHSRIWTFCLSLSAPFYKHPWIITMLVCLIIWPFSIVVRSFPAIYIVYLRRHLAANNPARATAAASAAASSSSAPSSSSTASKRGKGYGRSPLEGGQPKEELTRSASASRPPATCGLFSGGAGFAISSKCGRQWALLSRCWFFVCGFVIPFAHPPRLSLPTPASFVNFSRPDYVTLIDAEVEALQEEGAIEEVFPSSLGYFLRRWVGVPSSTSNSSTAFSSIAPAFTWTR